MYRLETDLSGICITRMGVGDNEKGRCCTLMYATYMRERPIPSSLRANSSVNNLTLWTGPFFTHNGGVSHISLWEPGVLYRLPQTALNELGGDPDLCAAPLHLEIQHTPYPGFAEDDYGRGSADGEQRETTTALHIGAHTPCLLAPRDTLIDWIEFFGSLPEIAPILNGQLKRKGLDLSWLDPLCRAGDVRIEPIPCLLDRPVELIREKVTVK